MNEQVIIDLTEALKRIADGLEMLLEVVEAEREENEAP